jgi:hypothetical protein
MTREKWHHRLLSKTSLIALFIVISCGTQNEDVFIYNEEFLANSIAQNIHGEGGIIVNKLRYTDSINIGGKDGIKYSTPFYVWLTYGILLPDGETPYYVNKNFYQGWSVLYYNDAKTDSLEYNIEPKDFGKFFALYKYMPDEQKTYIQTMINLLYGLYDGTGVYDSEDDFQMMAGKSNHWSVPLRVKINRRIMPTIGELLISLNINKWIGEICLAENQVTGDTYFKFWDPIESFNLEIYLGKSDDPRIEDLWAKYGRDVYVASFTGKVLRRSWQEDGLYNTSLDNYWFTIEKKGDNGDCNYLAVLARGNSKFEIDSVYGKYFDMKWKKIHGRIALDHSIDNGRMMKKSEKSD